MILTTRYESNPKATAWNGTEKSMSLKKHLNSTVSFVDIFQNIDRMVYSR